MFLVVTPSKKYAKISSGALDEARVLFVGRLADAKSAGQRDSHSHLVHLVSPARGVIAPTIVAREGEIETVGCAVVVAVESGERKG